jgi:hypothetical protein
MYLNHRVSLVDGSPSLVALCVIATGKYRVFVPRLIRSARRYFLPTENVSFVVFSDGSPIPSMAHYWYKVETVPWPGPTILRYQWMHKASALLGGFDYVFYVDADAEFVETVDNGILSDLVVVEHTGWMHGPVNHEWPHEKRPECRAYVPPEERVAYYAGGFQGGHKDTFLPACQAMSLDIDNDTRDGVTATWHDESHLNCYVTKHPPTLVLPGTWACDEIDRFPGARLLWLRKDHDAIRANETTR